MRKILFLVLFATFHCVLSKNNVKSLTESLGQEVIEIGTPIKELPPDLEEEPSAENDEEEKSTSLTVPVGTKRESKKPITQTTVDTRRRNKEADTTKQDDEEARIEKELAEIYKDNIDYKSDSSEVVKEVTKGVTEKLATTTKKEKVVKMSDKAEKPIGRVLAKNFKFQPDTENRAEVERFRTSVDEISCDQRNLMKGTPASSSPDSYEQDSPDSPDSPDSATANSIRFLFYFTTSIMSIFVFN